MNMNKIKQIIVKTIIIIWIIISLFAFVIQAIIILSGDYDRWYIAIVFASNVYFSCNYLKQTMAKILLVNPKYEISSQAAVSFDLTTPVNELAKNPDIKITFTLPYRTPCPCCNARMRKIAPKQWQCTKQPNVFSNVE